MRIAIAAATLTLMATSVYAAPAPQNGGTKCVSIQAKCALANGGKCNPKTGFWGIGATVVKGGQAGGSHAGWLDCVSRAVRGAQ